MQKIREKLVSALGVAGYILFYGVYALITFAPLVCVLDLNPLLDVLIVTVIMLFGYIGAVVELGLWSWSFIVSLNMPYDVFMLIYYIAFSLFAIRFLYLVISLIAHAIKRPAKKSSKTATQPNVSVSTPKPDGRPAADIPEKKPENRVCVEAWDGSPVWVPESRVSEYLAEQEKIRARNGEMTEEDKAFAKLIAEGLKKRMSESVPKSSDQQRNFRVPMNNKPDDTEDSELPF